METADIHVGHKYRASDGSTWRVDEINGGTRIAATKMIDGGGQHNTGMSLKLFADLMTREVQ
jgi:hypothetical protein